MGVLPKQMRAQSPSFHPTGIAASRAATLHPVGGVVLDASSRKWDVNSLIPVQDFWTTMGILGPALAISLEKGAGEAVVGGEDLMHTITTRSTPSHSLPVQSCPLTAQFNTTWPPFCPPFPIPCLTCPCRKLEFNDMGSMAPDFTPASRQSATGYAAGKYFHFMHFNFKFHSNEVFISWCVPPLLLHEFHFTNVLLAKSHKTELWATNSRYSKNCSNQHLRRSSLSHCISQMCICYW